MKVYDELVARGLIAQVTNEDEIRSMIDEGSTEKNVDRLFERIADVL